MTDDVLFSPPPFADSTAALVDLPPSPFNQNPAVVYLASLSEGSRLTMRVALNTIAGLLGIAEQRDTLGHDVRCFNVPWAALRHRHTCAVRDQVRERYAPATAKKLLTALRRVLREAQRLGQLSTEDYNRAIDIGSIRAEQRPRGRLVTEGEITLLLDSCANDPTPAGARDMAIIALLWGIGLRRAEVAGLDLDDYGNSRSTITLQSSQGKKAYLANVPSSTRTALNSWLLVRGDAPGPLFYGVVKGGKLLPRRLAGQAITLICANRAAEVKIEPLTPHDLRRTFFTGQFHVRAVSSMFEAPQLSSGS